LGMADTAMWAKRVDEWRKSEQSAREFTAGREFSAGGLRYWAHRLKREAVPASSTVVPMARVIRSLPETGPTGALAPRPVAREAAIVIEIGAARISVRPGFDVATLTAVVDALSTRRGEA
jgi:hypothetical protein